MRPFAILMGLVVAAALAATGATAKGRAPRAGGAVLARHLDQAVAIDAQSRALEAQRRAVAARYHTSDSITPGSPYVAGSHRSDVRGNLRPAEENEIEVGMPVWLPGQRDAFESTVATGVKEVEERLALRRLEVAGLVRDAWWSAQRAARELQIARDRLATARDIGFDMTQRVSLGDAAPADALLARNELLAAEAELVQVEAAARATRAAYGVLTAGATPDGTLESPAERPTLENHPALRAPAASLERAISQARLAGASFIDNPEIGAFLRNERSLQTNAGPDPQDYSRTNSTTVGLRFKIPLPTPGRNEPKIAEAEAEAERADAEYERAERLLKAEIKAAEAAVAAARRLDGIAAKRLGVADEQFALARKAFRLGEINAADLYRLRQQQLDAQRARASAAVGLGVAQSRAKQAYGYAPGRS
jgi:outer membrane protein, heavy metal efflux system